MNLLQWTLPCSYFKPTLSTGRQCLYSLKNIVCSRKHSQVVWDQQQTSILQMPSSTHELQFWVRPSALMDNSIHLRPTLFHWCFCIGSQRQKWFLSLCTDSSQAESEIDLKPILYNCPQERSVCCLGCEGVPQLLPVQQQETKHKQWRFSTAMLNHAEYRYASPG